MKKLIPLFAVLVLVLAGCGDMKNWNLSLKIPAGYPEPYAFSDEEFSTGKDVLEIQCENAHVVLRKSGAKNMPVQESTADAPGKFTVEPGQWYQAGVRLDAVPEEECSFSLVVKHAALRIQ